MAVKTEECLRLRDGDTHCGLTPTCENVHIAAPDFPRQGRSEEETFGRKKEGECVRW